MFSVDISDILLILGAILAGTASYLTGGIENVLLVLGIALMAMGVIRAIR